MQKHSIFTVTCSLIILTLVGCRDNRNLASNETESLDIPEMISSGLIDIFTIEEQPLIEHLTLSGRTACNPEHLSVVFPPMGGRIEQVYVTPGDKVSRNMRLARISSAQMADIQHQLSSISSQIELTQKNLNSIQEMASSGVASIREVLEVRQELSNFQGEKQRLLTILSYCHPCGIGYYELRSPISGYVVDQRVSSGMLLPDSFDDTLFVIANTDEVWVMADVFENDLSKIQLGQSAKVTTLAYPDTLFCGRVDRIYPIVDPDRKTLQVRISLSNRSHKLTPGMFVTSTIELAPSAIRCNCMPSSAVVYENGKSYVVMLQGQNPTIVPVEVKMQQEGVCYLSSGVATGQQVVSTNALLLFNHLIKSSPNGQIH